MNTEKLSISAIRSLVIDSVENAKHGHMGMPLGAAPMAYTLFKKHLVVNPKNTEWFNRDRFILTSGHGSMLLYALLHLSGFDVSINDLKQFRKLHSKTPGHPEVEKTPGVEATTGPLGQGFAMSVGFAIAEAHLAERFNKPDFNVVSHFTYTICGDGDLEEGVAVESATIAGNLGLGKLIVLYDANKVTSDGPLELSSKENVKEKFEAMNWHVIEVEDGNSVFEINEAIENSQKEKSKPSLIIVNTTIGYGSTLQGTNKIHSNPVGVEEANHIKKVLEWDYDEFEIPQDVYNDLSSVKERGELTNQEWLKTMDFYKERYPKEWEEFNKLMNGEFTIPTISPFTEEKIATRTASGVVLNQVYPQMPILLGGSADLASSNKTEIKGYGYMNNISHKEPNIHFGVREFAMAAIGNGVCLHGGLRGYCGTFLVFSDYMRSAIRHSALMQMPMIYLMTHDSIHVGQDGPTHQPIEHLMSFRNMPNITIFRPADATETIAGWKIALKNLNKPTLLALGRHDVPVLKNSNEELAERGAYIISEEDEQPDLLIIATGSEVELALQIKERFNSIKINVISMPSWELFDIQDDIYKEKVLPKSVKKRVSLEFGSTIGWERYVGNDGLKIGVNEFGDSAPIKDILEDRKLTIDDLTKLIDEYLKSTNNN